MKPIVAILLTAFVGVILLCIEYYTLVFLPKQALYEAQFKAESQKLELERRRTIVGCYDEAVSQAQEDYLDNIEKNDANIGEFGILMTGLRLADPNNSDVYKEIEEQEKKKVAGNNFSQDTYEFYLKKCLIREGISIE